jgi:hypothetical protein
MDSEIRDRGKGVGNYPHGTLDTIFAQALPQIKGLISWALFICAYLILAALVVILWWCAPTVFLLGFLAVSILHFSGDLGASASFFARLFY